MANSTHVPAQFLGYSIQTTRMTCLLLKTQRGSTVSLEVFEDIGVTNQDGSRVAQQAKSTTSSQNPISDFSKELWKTFSNWIDAVDRKELLVDSTTFEIYVTTEQDGYIAKELSDAQKEEDVDKVLDEIESLYKQRKPKLSGELICYVEKVLNYDRRVLQKLFKQFHLHFGQNNIFLELVQVLETNQAIPDDIIQEVGKYLLGWVKERVESQIQNNMPALITEDEFRKELVAIIRKLDRSLILESFAPNPEKSDVENEKVQTYVLQLDIIDADEDEKLEAINDYLRSRIERFEWSRRGLVSKTSFADFSNELLRIWRNSKTKIVIAHKNVTEVDKGKLLFTECMGVQQNLQGLSVPRYFLAGSFHTIADELLIGWHPRFEEILRKNNRSEEKPHE
jgi:hypothetical protein